ASRSFSTEAMPQYTHFLSNSIAFIHYPCVADYLGYVMQATEPIHVYYRCGRKSGADGMMQAQNALEKGNLEEARRKADAVIKADPTFYVAYYVRAEVLLQQRKYREAAQDCNRALSMDRTFGEAALLRTKANY